ncbi:fibroblast growth factor 22 isoform X2 [Phacochoerus africanus]|uniref:fibroblast growth factor 22 isoform X2 n=1 Tax=Phacochoerus africanus TaxID=41426 RepID=UPI001FDAB552|nr:fibroblast growth factor 22 isoform X2 [Phacochoerus africanus]
MRGRLWLGLAWLLLARAPGAAGTRNNLRRPRSYPHLEGDVRWRRLFSSTHFFLLVDPSGRVQGTRWHHSPDSSGSISRRTDTIPTPLSAGSTWADPCSWRWMGAVPPGAVASRGNTTCPPTSCPSWSPEADRPRAVAGGRFQETDRMSLQPEAGEGPATPNTCLVPLWFYTHGVPAVLGTGVTAGAPRYGPALRAPESEGRWTQSEQKPSQAGGQGGLNKAAARPWGALLAGHCLAEAGNGNPLGGEPVRRRGGWGQMRGFGARGTRRLHGGAGPGPRPRMCHFPWQRRLCRWS